MVQIEVFISNLEIKKLRLIYYVQISLKCQESVENSGFYVNLGFI